MRKRLLSPSAFRRTLLLAAIPLALAGAAVLFALVRAPSRGTLPAAAGNPEEALRAAIRSAPRDPQPHLALVRLLLAARRSHDGLDAAREAQALFPESVPVRLLLADALLAAGRKPEAAAALRPLASIAPHYALQLAAFLVRDGRHDAAARIAREQRGLAPELSIRAGQVLLDARQPAAALPFFRAAASASPAPSAAPAHLGFALLCLGRYAEAIPPLERAAAAAPSAATLQLYLGSAIRLSGKLDRLPEAAAHLRRATELEPSEGLFAYELALAQVQLRDWSGARATMERAADLSPTAPEIQRDLARLHSRAGDDTAAALARAREARVLGDAPAAVRELQPRFARDPRNVRLGLALAEAHYDAVQTPQALSLLQRLEAHAPADTAILESRFRAERAANHHQEALRALEAVAAHAPDTAWLPEERADLLQRLGRYTEAERVLAGARDRQPGTALRHYQLGAFLVQWSQRADRTAAAEASFRRALELQPEHVSSRYRLGLLLEASGRPREAVLELRRALDLAPELTDGLRVLGRAYLATGDRARSDETFRLHRRLKAQEDEQARLELPRGLGRATRADRMRLAAFYLRAGKQQAAAGELEALFRRHPDAVESRRELILLLGITRRFQRQFELREPAGAPAGGR